MNNDKISFATELSQLCLVPELTTDIDTQQIEAAHFKEFKQILDENLHLLFDLLQQYEGVLFEKTRGTEDFRKFFILFLCEQSADNAPYKTDQLILQQNIIHLLHKWFRNIVDEKCIFDLIMQHYKTLIKVDVWKKNIGTIFGFHKFCQLNYKCDNSLQMNEVFFVLATGTLLLEHYEPMYKQIGIDLYNILMSSSNKLDVFSANIHNAIYATCLPNIQKIQDHRINLKLWICLYKCLEMDDSWKRTSDWHKIDELMMELLKRIAFEGNIHKSTILFNFAAKFGSLPHPKRFIVDELDGFSATNGIDHKFLDHIDWDLLRSEYKQFDSFSIYKWVKKMLLLISNQNMFYGEYFEVAFYLQAIHLTYITWIFSIPLKLISTQILDMLTKFVPTLLDCYRRYETNELVCSEIRQLFTTFLKHFEVAQVHLCSENVNLRERLITLLLIKNAIG